MKITATQMRASRDDYSQAVKTAKLNGFCDVRRVPVEMFEGTPFAILFPIALKNGPQRVSVIDLADHIGAEVRPCLQVALFRDNSANDLRPALNDNHEFSGNVYALAVFPDEGAIGFLCEDGAVYQSGDEEIIVHVGRGSSAEQRELAETMLDEYADSLG